MAHKLMDNKKFLEKVAEVLLNRSEDDLLETVVVFPNKRPEIFLKKYLKEQTTRPLWMPDVRSIDELITELSPLTVQDSMVSWFELFEIHKEIEGENARHPDEFINWAPIMLRDFNDADMALVNVKELFSFLSKAKALERWHPDGTSLTDFEKAYLDFYNKLFQYYDRLKKSLAERGLGTKGMVYRKVAESVEKERVIPWKQFIFAGFNALTKAEEKLIRNLKRSFPVTLLWDVDEYYIYPKKHNLPWQEAGLPLHRIFKNLKIDRPEWIENNLVESEKDITLVAAPKQVSEVKFTGQLLAQWTSSESTDSPVDTAIVLADEKLLIPLLTSLPKGETTYNVTMGYPLTMGSLSQFLTLWIDLLVRQNEQTNRTYATALVLSMLQNSSLQFLLHAPEAAISKIKSFNREFLSRDKVLSCFKEEDSAVADTLFQRETNAMLIFERIMKLLLQLKSRVDVAVDRGERFAKDTIIEQQLSSLLVVMKKLFTVVSGNENYFSLKVFQKVFTRLVAGSEISLKGEPLNGIQVMGMLETRLLDFKRVIILSANEGMLPKNSSADSFVPFDIRKEFALPLPDEENAIFAYHFFRLLQRAEEVVMVYNSEEGNFGSGEKSRFLFQLEIEAVKANPNLHLHHHFLKIEPGNHPDENNISIPKSETVLKKLDHLRAKGLSPSALNQYIKCPLQFYFSRILKLKVSDGVKSNLEANVFGTVVHEVLEEVYKPFIDKPIDTKQLAKTLVTLDYRISESLKKNYPSGDVTHGKNLLTIKVLKRYLERFLQQEIQNLQKEPRILVAVEKELQQRLVLPDGKEVIIKGIIDRIDRVGLQLRISDYKTGTVKKSEVNFKEWDQLLSESKYSKAFQTLTYGWLFQKNFPQTKQLQLGLFSLRNLSDGFIEPGMQADNPEDWLAYFEIVLTALLTEIFDRDNNFIQTPDSSNCEWCDFKTICNK